MRIRAMVAAEVTTELVDHLLEEVAGEILRTATLANSNRRGNRCRLRRPNLLKHAGCRSNKNTKHRRSNSSISNNIAVATAAVEMATTTPNDTNINKIPTVATTKLRHSGNTTTTRINRKCNTNRAAIHAPKLGTVAVAAALALVVMVRRISSVRNTTMIIATEMHVLTKATGKFNVVVGALATNAIN